MAVALLSLTAWVFRAPEARAVCLDLPGTCNTETFCTADESEGKNIIDGITNKYAFCPIICQGSFCTPKGQVLCTMISTVVMDKAYVCVPGGQCNGKPLTTDVGDIGETCVGGQVCCDTSPGEKATPTPTTPSTGGGSPVTLTNPLGAGATFYTIIRNVIQAFLGMVGALALLVFVYAGVLWMTAGSSDRVQKAKDTMKYAVIGLAMIAFSYVITSFMVDALLGNIAPPEAPAEPEYALPPEVNE